MSVQVVSSATNPCWLEVVQALRPLLAGVTLEVHSRVDGKLARFGCSGGPVLVFVADDVELDALLADADRLAGQRLIVVLHDASPASRAKGHALRPRVLFTPPVEPREIAAVVAKMLDGDRRQPWQAGAVNRWH
jgi:hypothetical protein